MRMGPLWWHQWLYKKRRDLSWSTCSFLHVMIQCEALTRCPATSTSCFWVSYSEEPHSNFVRFHLSPARLNSWADGVLFRKFSHKPIFCWVLFFFFWKFQGFSFHIHGLSSIGIYFHAQWWIWVYFILLCVNILFLSTIVKMMPVLQSMFLPFSSNIRCV